MAQKWHKLNENHSTLQQNQRLREVKYQNHNGLCYFTLLCERFSAMSNAAHLKKCAAQKWHSAFGHPNTPF